MIFSWIINNWYLYSCDIFVESLDSWEALTLSDSLEAITYSDGGVVVKQGEPGDDFFIIVNVINHSSSCFSFDVCHFYSRVLTAVSLVLFNSNVFKGEAKVLQRKDGESEEVEVGTLKTSDYFGQYCDFTVSPNNSNSDGVKHDFPMFVFCHIL